MTPTASNSILESATVTVSPIPTNTITATPTATPTASITPLPTIPTFTPTFDASTIVTVTPAPKAECPEENASLKANFKPSQTLDNYELSDTQRINSFLDFLNSGGSLPKVLSEMRSDYYQSSYEDVTGDNVKDLLFVDESYPLAEFHIIYCKKGKYKIFTTDKLNYTHPYILKVDDLNLDGLLDIVLIHRADCSMRTCPDYAILQWNGSTFVDLAIDEFGNRIGIFGLKKNEIGDLNRDGLKELILIGDDPQGCCVFEMIPWRFMTIIYSWNGRHYAETYSTFEPPQYRFQVIQDADRESNYGHYDKALAYYQNAIFDKSLMGYSPEIHKNLQETYELESAGSSTPTPEPPASDEYPKLASYAYYRIMLLHLVQGNETEGRAIYKTAEQNFGGDPYGRPYVEMATEFWGAYQSTNRIYDGCAAAIQYAIEYPEILIPLGSDYHGWQSHIYAPEDVCPFR